MLSRRDALRWLAGGVAAWKLGACARTTEAAREVTGSPPRTVPLYYSAEYTLAAQSFDTTRKAAWVAADLEKRPIAGVELRAPASLTAAELARVHHAHYVEAVRTGTPRELAESQGFRWDAGLWTMVCATNGGAVAAALAAMRGGVAGSLSSGLHHARADEGRGFCTFNGLALASRRAQAAGARRILIVDLDAHCGGGTHSLVGEDEGVRILDVSVNAFDHYTPTGRHTLDVVRQAADYLPQVRVRLDELGDETFDLCLYNAGMDPHEGCPIGGLRGIDAAILAERETLVFEWARKRSLPVAFVLAGGYIGDLTQEALVDVHRLTLSAAARSVAG